jgi:uncharacterized protein YeaO (DUF488 family)
LKAPHWFTGIQYKTLAPTGEIFAQQKANPNEDLYISRFNNEVLGILDRNHVLQELSNLGNKNDIVLLCYEKPTNFCHRRLVADWLNELHMPHVNEWTQKTYNSTT